MTVQNDLEAATKKEIEEDREKNARRILKNIYNNLKQKKESFKDAEVIKEKFLEAYAKGEEALGIYDPYNNGNSIHIVSGYSNSRN